MKFRLSIKPDEIPVDEKRHSADDDEANIVQLKSPFCAGQVDDDKSDLVNLESQHGVQSVQAMTQVWSRQHLILAYVMYVLILN
ncbi:hypothetical protein BDV26DRAFT_270531, partial [Aspergillus bertholletiae]